MTQVYRYFLPSLTPHHLVSNILIGLILIQRHSKTYLFALFLQWEAAWAPERGRRHIHNVSGKWSPFGCRLNEAPTQLDLKSSASLAVTNRKASVPLHSGAANLQLDWAIICLALLWFVHSSRCAAKKFPVKLVFSNFVPLSEHPHK